MTKAPQKDDRAGKSDNDKPKPLTDLQKRLQKERRICNFCEKEYTPVVVWQRYCDDACRINYWKKEHYELARMERRLRNVEARLDAIGKKLLEETRK